MKLLKALMLLSLLTACTTQQDVLKLNAKACEDAGFKPKTEAHFNCTVQMEQLRLQRWKGASESFSRMQRPTVYQNTYKY